MAKKVAKSAVIAPKKKAAPKKTESKKTAPKKAVAKKAVAKKATGQKAVKAIQKTILVPPPSLQEAPDARVLDQLWRTVVARAALSPAESHSARLLARGTAKVAQKFGEEAVECVIEAVAKNHMALIGESADVLYHLLVLWVDAGLRPEEVWQELARRQSLSGLMEKGARKLTAPDLMTTKIP